MKLLLIILSLLIFSCTSQRKCNRKIRYINDHCSNLISSDSVISYISDTMHITDIEYISDTIQIVDTVVDIKSKEKIIIKTRYIDKAFKYKNGKVNIEFKNGVLKYNIPKIIIKQTNTITIKEKLPWWKIGIVCFIIFIVILIILVLLK